MNILTRISQLTCLLLVALIPLTPQSNPPAAAPVTLATVVKQVWTGGSDFSNLTDKPVTNTVLVWSKCTATNGSDLSNYSVSLLLKTATQSAQIAMSCTAAWSGTQTSFAASEPITSAVATLQSIVNTAPATLLQ
jgi:hypothetical protein